MRTPIDLREPGGNVVRLYDPSAVCVLIDGPPTVVVGTETCVLGITREVAVLVGMTSTAAAEALGVDLGRAIALTAPGGRLLYLLQPERVVLVTFGETGSTVVIDRFGPLHVREAPHLVREAIASWLVSAESFVAGARAAEAIEAHLKTEMEDRFLHGSGSTQDRGDR